MKHYDHIYVPNEQFGIEVKVSNTEWDTIQEQKDVVVLTIEELKDMWQSAKEYRDREEYARNIGRDTYSTAPDLETYLQSKGIQTT